MRQEIHGPVKKKVLVSKRSVGYKPKREGIKRRKTMRGNEITADMTLINVVVEEFGKTELFNIDEEKESE